jgi:branched-chain amino acid transport system substrate-binding protein
MVTLAAGCGSSSSGDSASSSGPVRIVLIVPLSGPAGVYGQQLVDGMRVATAQINAAGGIDKRKVDLVTYNTATDPAQAVSQFQKAMQQGTINLVVPGLIGQEVQAVLPLVTRAGLVAMGTDNTPEFGNAAKFPRYFSFSAGGTATMNKLIDTLAAQHVKNVGLLFGNDTLGAAEQATATADLKAHGIKITDTESIPITATNVTPQVERLKQSGAQALVYDVTGAASFLVLQTVGNLGWKVPIYAGIAQSTLPLQGQAPAAVLGHSVGVAYRVEVAGSVNPYASRVTALMADLAKSGIRKVDPWLPGVGYDMPYVYEAAVKKAGSTDPAKVAAALRSITVSQAATKLVVGDYKWSADSNWLDPGNSLTVASLARNSAYLHVVAPAG